MYIRKHPDLQLLSKQIRTHPDLAFFEKHARQKMACLARLAWRIRNLRAPASHTGTRCPDVVFRISGYPLICCPANQEVPDLVPCKSGSTWFGALQIRKYLICYLRTSFNNIKPSKDGFTINKQIRKHLICWKCDTLMSSWCHLWQFRRARMQAIGKSTTVWHTTSNRVYS